MPKKYFETLNNAFLAHFARRLADLIIEQSRTNLQDLNLDTPVTAVSTLLFLDKAKSSKVTDVAAALGVSHQMAAQRISTLQKVALIERTTLPNDRRSRLISLTKKGQAEAEALKDFTAKVSQVIVDLETEIDCDLTAALRRAELALLREPIVKRLEKNSMT